MTKEELIAELEKEEEDFLKFAVDIPQLNGYGGVSDEWRNIDYFETKEEAIKFVQEKFGADDEGRVSLVSEVTI